MTNTFTSFNQAEGRHSLARDTAEAYGMGRQTAMEISPTNDGGTAMAAAGIDWTVEATKLDSVFEAPNAEDTTISTRSDTGAIVGINGKKHNIIQNDVLAEFGDAIRNVRPDAQYVAGGNKSGGATTFLMLELPDGLDLGGGDVVKRQLLIGTHHNGGKLFTAAVQFRPFCLNQWSGLMRGKQRLIEVSHTASAEQRIKDAVFTLEAAVTTFDEWDQGLRDLLSQTTSLTPHVSNIVGDKPTKEGRGMTEWENRVDRLWGEYSQDFNSGLVGTGFGVLMAAQGADEHSSRVKKGQRAEQRVGRMINGNYPLAQRAVRSLATV